LVDRQDIAVPVDGGAAVSDGSPSGIPMHACEWQQGSKQGEGLPNSHSPQDRGQ
jgi:hypothetical protein